MQSMGQYCSIVTVGKIYNEGIEREYMTSEKNFQTSVQAAGRALILISTIAIEGQPSMFVEIINQLEIRKL